MIKSTVRIEDRDTGLNKIKKEFKGGAVDIGVFGEKDSDVVIYAASNEFGTTRIPQRSFLRGGVDEKKGNIRNKLDQGKDNIVRGKITTEKFLKGLGLYVAKDVIVDRINRSKEWATRNALATIRKKTVAGKVGDQPLVDTGRLRQSITYRVVK